jgi:outer membrane protein OmpA-like peptidoglycan-associated protein
MTRTDTATRNGGRAMPAARLAMILTLLVGAAALAGCGTTPAPAKKSGDCTTELDGFAPYTGANCNVCENVTYAAPGEPPRCAGAEPRAAMTDSAVDADGDGVVDRRDACLDTSPGQAVLSNGCARITLRDVTFELDSARLTQRARGELDRQVSYLRRARHLRVEIAGHTDGQGSADYNRDLSLRRARSVRDYFVEHGIATDRLEVAGYGESRPVEDNATAAGRERNRRVELGVVDAGDDSAG